MPRGHGLHLRGDLMGSLDDTNRFLANEMAGLGRWIMAVATALTNGAADYEAAEQAITLAIGEPTASSGS